MASPSDRDKESKDSSQKPDNPFIKFRQFADSQISSLLQGIIGLPSAFTKSPNNARWADFDEDMRRRDELQIRQKELRDSDARRAETQKQSQAGGSWPHWLNEKSNTSDDEEMNDKMARDIPLYSPVAKSLFAHLRVAKEDRWGGSAEWRPLPERGLNWSSFHYDPLNTWSPAQLMTALRSDVYRDLNVNPILRSRYSLLPYLLFSPYSPIKLEKDELHQFPYCDAFQDLVLITEGRPMGSLSSTPFGMVGPTGPERAWIYHLWANGVLQQSGTTSNPRVAAFQESLQDLCSVVKSQFTSLPPWSLESDEEAQTELEMYERFLRRASSSTGIAEILESMFTDAEGWVNKQLASPDPTEMRRQMKEFIDFLERNTGDEAEDEKRANAVKALESLFSQAVEMLEKRPNDTTEVKREKFTETKIGKELEDLKRKAADPKAVFTSTTTEHTTNEDGSVETSVTVWKRYADGRETTTTTSHIEEPACCEDDDDDDEFHQQTGFPKAPEQKKEDTKEDKKGDKKGWFWN